MEVRQTSEKASSKQSMTNRLRAALTADHDMAIRHAKLQKSRNEDALQGPAVSLIGLGPASSAGHDMEATDVQRSVHPEVAGTLGKSP